MLSSPRSPDIHDTDLLLRRKLPPGGGSPSQGCLAFPPAIEAPGETVTAAAGPRKNEQQLSSTTAAYRAHKRKDLPALIPDRPLAEVPPRRWQCFVDDVGLFLDRPFSGTAAALGWGPHDLFGCDRDRPFARIDQVGLLLAVEWRHARRTIGEHSDDRDANRRAPNLPPKAQRARPGAGLGVGGVTTEMPPICLLCGNPAATAGAVAASGQPCLSRARCPH